MGRAILIIGAGALLVGIWLYAVIDSARAEKSTVRTLPKAAWVLVTFLFPLVGSLLWLFLGRPKVVSSPGRTAGYRAPDDDEDYLRFLEQKERRMRESRKKTEGDEPSGD